MKHKPRPEVTPARITYKLAERCESCGKFCYLTRDDAKRARKRIGAQSGLRVYVCPGSGWFHLGHLPRAVRRGEYGREAI